MADDAPIHFHQHDDLWEGEIYVREKAGLYEIETVCSIRVGKGLRVTADEKKRVREIANLICEHLESKR